MKNTSQMIKYRPLEKRDLEDLFSLYHNESFQKGYGEAMDHQQTKEQLEAWYEHYQKSLDECYFSIEMGRKQKWVGFMTLTDFNESRNEAWISIGIHPTYWGIGIGTISLNQLIHHCFFKERLKTLRLSVFSTNERALALYLKSGFKVEMIYKQHQTLNGFDTEIYQLYLNRMPE